jgi:hypothetical protein
LLHAQNATPDDGVAQGYHAVHRCWGASYPETTGYIICSLIRAADAGFDVQSKVVKAAIRMGRWLVTTQLVTGAFPGGTIAESTPRPAVFNTGQILKGMSVLLEKGYDPRGDIVIAAARASKYMRESLDEDGCWRKGISHLTSAPVHVYNIRAAWGLARYAGLVNDEASMEAAKANALWVCKQQRSDGWFDYMNFDLGEPPLTHTIAYTIQGLMEIGAILKNSEMIDRSVRAAERVFRSQDEDSGAIPGQFAENWCPVGNFTSMTGNAQMAVVAHRIASLTGDKSWRDRATRATAVCKRFQETDHQNINRRGALRGAYPSNGGYGSFWYMNWTQKFFLDALLCECGVDIT